MLFLDRVTILDGGKVESDVELGGILREENEGWAVVVEGELGPLVILGEGIGPA